MKKLAVIASHTIQYQTPLFKKLAVSGDVELKVYLCWDFGMKESYDSQFRQKISWDIPLLDGFDWELLKNISPRPSSSYWWGEINPGIIGALKKGHYDGLLVYGWNFATSWFAFITAIIYGIPLFIHGENPLHQELAKSPVKIFLKKKILGWLFYRASGVFYIGEENKKFYRFYGVPEEKLFFAPYSVDNERLMKEAKRLRFKREEFKAGLGIPLENVAVLFVGKLMAKKNPMDLLKAYENLNKKYKIQNISLIFVGDGELRKELEFYVRQNNIPQVHFAGFKNQTELPKYYSLADIFVLPSGAGETWGLVVNEAMCFNLPIIVSDVVGCGSDLVKQEKNGYVFPLGDIEKLAQYLKDLIKDGKKRNSFGKKSFEIIQGYSHEKDIRGILSVLKND